MQAKDKFLERISLIFFIAFFVLNAYPSQGKNIEQELTKHNNSLNNISIFFIQSDNESLEEGFIHIGKERIRVDYTSPKKISVVLSKKKGIYIDHELKESEFFSINNSFIKIYYNMFKDKDFFTKSDIQLNEKRITVKKNFFIEKTKYPVEIIYENNPIKLRRVTIEFDKKKHTLSFVSYTFVKDFRKKFFKLIDPYLTN
jgi:hypothetical protein